MPISHFRNPKPVTAETYLSRQGFHDFDEVGKQIEETEKENKKRRREEGISTTKQPQELNDGVLAQIKKKVGVRVRKPRAKDYIQPEELKDLQGEIAALVQEVGVQLIKSNPISYGRQLRFKAEKHWAELNIFYGKKGATVVKTAKTGSNKDLVEMLHVLIKDYFENR